MESAKRKRQLLQNEHDAPEKMVPVYSLKMTNAKSKSPSTVKKGRWLNSSGGATSP